MTNAEYIISRISDIDIAKCMTELRHYDTIFESAYHAWRRWAISVSPNIGNMAKGRYTNSFTTNNPSIWAFENWYYPDGIWRKSGRTNNVSVQVWLTMQYNPDEWSEKDD